MRSRLLLRGAGSAALALVLALAATGCGARKREAAAKEPARSPGVGSNPAAAERVASVLPREIQRPSEQVIVYECATCDRMYDLAGTCPRDGGHLYPTKLTYVCAYDGTIAERYGACPSCGRTLKIEKAKMLPSGIRVVRTD